MRNRWLIWLRGYVLLQVVTNSPAAFIQHLKKKQFVVWDATISEDDKLLLYLTVPDFRRCRASIRETGTQQVSILRRYGWPFLGVRLQRRKLLLAGLFIACLLIYAASSMIWFVHVEGNERYSEEQILRSARKQGIYPFQWKFGLAEPLIIARRMQQRLPGTTWVGIEVRGVTVTVRVVESSNIERKPKPPGHHLVASKSAVISRVYTVRGLSKVSVHDRVQRGDVLISGWIGNEQKPRLVQADGIVKGLVWYHMEVKVPLRLHRRVLTGVKFQRKYVVAGFRAIQYEGFDDPGFAKPLTRTEWDPARWLGQMLGIGMMTETVYQQRLDTELLTPAEARKRAVVNARESLLGRDPEKRIRKIIVQVVKRDAKSIRFQCFAEVEESIAIFSPR